MIYKVFQNKAIGCCAKMIYAFIHSKGGEYEYINKTELNDILGMSHPLINKGIKELLHYDYITHSKNKLTVK